MSEKEFEDLPALAPKDEVFLFAAQHQSLEEVLKSLDDGADINARDPKTGENALMKAVFNDAHGNSIVHALLDRGISHTTQSVNGAPVHAFATERFVDALDRILQLGVDPNTSIIPPSGWPLDFAAMNGCGAAAELLIRAGADVNKLGGAGRTAMHYVRSGEVVDALAGAGGIVDAIDEYGDTPLSNAIAWKTKIDVVDRLIAWGANVELEVKGLRPLHWALVHKRGDAFASLLAAGADPGALTGASQTVDDLIAEHGLAPEHQALLSARRAKTLLRSAIRRQPSTAP